MNTKKKGQKKETECSNLLKTKGYKIVFKGRTVKQGNFWVGTDFADLFDVIGILGTHWIFVSVKHYQKSGKFQQHQQDINEFATKHGLSGMSFELWLWHKPDYEGSGKNKHYNKGNFEIISIL